MDRSERQEIKEGEFSSKRSRCSYCMNKILPFDCKIYGKQVIDYQDWIEECPDFENDPKMTDYK